MKDPYGKIYLLLPLGWSKNGSTRFPLNTYVFFFKAFWHLAKPLILAIANGFALGRVDIAMLNMGVLSVIPKVPGG
jgi:hypothetical protein